MGVPGRGPPNSGNAGLDRQKATYGLLTGIRHFPFKVANPRPFPSIEALASNHTWLDFQQRETGRLSWWPLPDSCVPGGAGSEVKIELVSFEFWTPVHRFPIALTPRLSDNIFPIAIVCVRFTRWGRVTERAL
jgi:hypothetical protein